MRYWRSIRQRWYKYKPPQICWDVKTWARESGSELHTFQEFAPMVRQVPHTVAPEISPEYTSRLNGLGVSKYLAVLKNAKFAGKRGLMILPDGQYAAESVFTPEQVTQDPYYLVPPARAVYKRGNYFSLINAWAFGYYHWLHDSLLKLFQVHAVLPKDIQYIVPSDLKPWHLDILSVFGISPGQLVPFDHQQVWRLENLYFTNRTNHAGWNHPSCDFWVRNLFYDFFKIEESTPRLRLYISRNGMRKRFVLNEAEVMDLLAPLGFEIVKPETLSIGDQVKLFSQAEIVIAAHGSALTNLYFTSLGARVVDMIEPHMNSFRYVFWSLCESLGHQYWYLDAESVENSSGRADMRVDIEKLAATVARIGVA